MTGRVGGTVGPAGGSGDTKNEAQTRFMSPGHNKKHMRLTA